MAKRKLEKTIEGTDLPVKELETGEEMKNDFASLPKEIQAKLGPYGLCQKIGDAAAGKSGQVAVDSMNKVWEGLMANNWSVRAPAAPKLSKKDLLENLGKLAPKEQSVAKALLEKLGII